VHCSPGYLETGRVQQQQQEEVRQQQQQQQEWVRQQGLQVNRGLAQALLVALQHLCLPQPVSRLVWVGLGL
jgi:hypothetical protein